MSTPEEDFEEEIIEEEEEVIEIVEDEGKNPVDDDDDDVKNFNLELKNKSKKKKDSHLFPTFETMLEDFQRQMEDKGLMPKPKVFSTIDTSKPTTLPQPQMGRQGTKRVVYENFGQTCDFIKRDVKHVESFFKAELGTETSIDAKQQLILKGKYLATQLFNILVQYVNAYVKCKTCLKVTTTTLLDKDPVTRMQNLQCSSCTALTPTAPIRPGFHATNKSDRRKIKSVLRAL